tara:strand:+ start:215 stop:559 length:345 start_codon:yes stop_codon:yes gene_type:complete
MNNITKIENIAEQAHKENEAEFKQNKENINFVLKGNNKYYYANQCKIFTKLVTEKGFGNYISAETIKAQGISFNKYSINVGYSQYHQDLKRFNSKEEMLGFVIGYNEAQLQYDK